MFRFQYMLTVLAGTGIFAQPAKILLGTGGSKGAALFLWVLGGIMTFTGYNQLVYIRG